MIARTGRIYTYLWGSGFQYAARKTDAYDMFSKSILSKCAPEAKDLPIDRFVEIAQRNMPGNTLTIWFPRIANGVYLVTANNERGPQVNEVQFIGRATVRSVPTTRRDQLGCEREGRRRGIQTL